MLPAHLDYAWYQCGQIIEIAGQQWQVGDGVSANHGTHFGSLRLQQRRLFVHLHGGCNGARRETEIEHQLLIDNDRCVRRDRICESRVGDCDFINARRTWRFGTRIRRRLPIAR